MKNIRWRLAIQLALESGKGVMVVCVCVCAVLCISNSCPSLKVFLGFCPFFGISLSMCVCRNATPHPHPPPLDNESLFFSCVWRSCALLIPFFCSFYFSLCRLISILHSIVFFLLFIYSAGFRYPGRLLHTTGFDVACETREQGERGNLHQLIFYLISCYVCDSFRLY